MGIKEGKIITLSGAPGSGKSFLVNYILNSDIEIFPLISATTREKREHEIDGKDKFFVNSFRHKWRNKIFFNKTSIKWT